MEQEVNLNVIKSTQTTLGKHVKKPPLTDKLLKKPPFRFLHDIVTSVLKSTGFFDGLFDENELISDNVKDRENKIAFLNKIITVLTITTGKSITVKPSKIVAGQEPEKTNELLQLLAEALDRKLSSEAAVQKIKSKSKKSDEKPAEELRVPAQSKKISSDKNFTAKSSEKVSPPKIEAKTNRGDKVKSITNTKNKVKEAKGESKERNRRKENTSQKNLAQSKTAVKKSEKELQREKSLELSNIENKPNLEALASKIKDVNDHQENTTLETHVQESEASVPIQLNTSYTIAEKDLNSSASSHDLEANEGTEENSEAKQEYASNSSKPENCEALASKEVVRQFQKADNTFNAGSNSEIIKPQTPLKEFKKSNSEDSPGLQNGEINKTRPQSMRPSSSRPGAPRVREKHENVLAAAENNILIGKVNIITENTQNEEEDDNSIILVDEVKEASTESLQLSNNLRGHLVQQILESQKEYSQSGKTEIEWQFGAHKAREVMNQEIEQVRLNIQALSRVANPLGKLLDHVQEDVEVMRQELQQWQRNYEEASQLLSKQKLSNDDSLQPLHTKIKQLNADIRDKHEKINDLKVVIFKNSSRIDKLLANGNVQ